MRHIAQFFKTFWISSIVSVLCFVIAGYYLGIGALWILLILAAIEITFSFDNAIVNAKKLVRMSKRWQQVFLSVGIVIAIFGLRIILPLAIVGITADISWRQVIDLALYHPAIYAQRLEAAHPMINAFGGAFLLLLTLHFFFDHKKRTHWLHFVEVPATKVGLWWVPLVVTAIVVIIFGCLPANHHLLETIKAGFVGVITYTVLYVSMGVVDRYATEESSHAIKQLSGWSAFVMFVYLEILDASFSFDGVLGAFAITDKVILIALGLGIGAIWVRSLTVYMVRSGILEAYEFLEHGAYYAIGFLALVMFTGLVVPVPEIITGTVGLGIIGVSAYASTRLEKQQNASGFSA